VFLYLSGEINWRVADTVGGRFSDSVGWFWLVVWTLRQVVNRLGASSEGFWNAGLPQSEQSNHCIISKRRSGSDDVRFCESVEDPLMPITFRDGNQPDKEDNETISRNGREVSEQRFVK